MSNECQKSQEKSPQIHDLEGCGSSHSFTMDREKIFPYIRKSMGGGLPYMHSENPPLKGDRHSPKSEKGRDPKVGVW